MQYEETVSPDQQIFDIVSNALRTRLVLYPSFTSFQSIDQIVQAIADIETIRDYLEFPTAEMIAACSQSSGCFEFTVFKNTRG